MKRREFLQAMVACSAVAAMPLPAFVTEAPPYQGPVVIKMLSDNGFNFVWRIPSIALTAGRLTMGDDAGTMEMFVSSPGFEEPGFEVIGVPVLQTPDGKPLGIVHVASFEKMQGAEITVPFIPLNEDVFGTMEVA